MTSRKRNDFLDLPSDEDNDNHNDDHRAGRSDSDDRGYDSEAAEESRIRGRGSGRGRRLQAQPPAKRRRIGEDYLGDDGLESDSGGEEDSNEDEMKEGTKIMKGASKSTGSASQDLRFAAIFSGDEENEENEVPEGTSKTNGDSEGKELHDRNGENDTTHSPHNVKLKPIKASKKKNKTGVIYLSSLPPYLKPFALKNMLETRGFGPINRIFLTPYLPSSSSSTSSRRSANKRKTYTDGWVEFESKKTAKICAETLNASIVGGRKGGWYHDDVWNMKYLRGFKWADLMEQVQRERSEREAKRRIEDARARKEEKVFLAGVEKGRVLDGMKRKKEEKIKRLTNTEGDRRDGVGDGGQALTQGQAPVRRVFKQNEVKIRRDTDRNEAALAEDAKRVLGKIF